MILSFGQTDLGKQCSLLFHLNLSEAGLGQGTSLQSQLSDRVTEIDKLRKQVSFVKFLTL